MRPIVWILSGSKMNGFIYLENGEHPGCPDQGRTVLSLMHGTMKRESFAGKDVLLAWGYTAGDVHYVRTTDNSLTILCGYVSGIERGPNLADQEQSVRFIHESIAVNSSTAALTALLNRLHGSFAIFHRDVEKGISLCITDRVASRPLWRLWSAKSWILSSNPLALAASVPSINVDLGALGAFLLYGGPV